MNTNCAIIKKDIQNGRCESMKYSEDTLVSWTAPLSQTEEQRAENTIRMIKSAIDADDQLKSMSIEVFVQGSFANNTNVRSESDVDVCVMLKDTFHEVFPEGKSRADYGFIASSMTFQKYREMVKVALQRKFSAESVHDGNKSLKINENTYHVQADVVPAFQLRNYYYNGSTNPNDYVEGTWFVSKSGEEVSNYPKRHIRRGNEKNVATNYDYKKLVRIMKHIKNNMVDDHRANGDKITSFLVECLVYQVPNDIICRYSTWTDTVKNAIIYLYGEIANNRHKDWTEVSGMLYLFINRKWTDTDVKQWLSNAWDYLGYGD